MFLKAPRPSTDQRLRSLLQKAARRGYTEIVELATARLDASGDKTWLRSRAIVITFEECWPLATDLHIEPGLRSKCSALIRVTRAEKQKDAAGLGALAHAYQQGDESMLDCVPDRHVLRMVAESLNRPPAFYEWALREARSEQAAKVIRASQRYLAAATWPWDKATILAGALLAKIADIPTLETTVTPEDEFPYWVALDKHTPEGKVALGTVAKELRASYRHLIWAGFYCESARVNRLLPSAWWEAEKSWRLRRAGLSVDSAEALWSRARPFLLQRLESEAESLKTLLKPDLPLYAAPTF